MSNPPDLVTAPIRTRFLHGLKMPLRGLTMMVRTPTLWAYVIGPIALTALMLGGALWVTLAYGGAATEALFAAPDGQGWFAGAGRALWFVLNATVHLVLFGALAVVGWFVGMLLSSPFYDQLSARVEHLVRGEAIDSPVDWRQVASDVATGIGHSLASFALFLGATCPLLLLNVVPVAGEVLYLVASVSLSAAFLAREVLDYSMSRRRYAYVAKLRLVREHAWVTAGLGLGSLAFLSVPLANFLSTPSAVIGGTLLFCELEAQGLVPPPNPPR